MPSPNTPLLQGTLDLIVLQLLNAAPTNGYDLALRIQNTTGDVAGDAERPARESLLADPRRAPASQRSARGVAPLRRRPHGNPSRLMMMRGWLWLRSILFRRRLEREMDEEMSTHLGRSVERFQAA